MAEGPGSKVLLMGRAGAGKTSMRSIIFANYLARETTRLHPTVQVEHSTLKFLGDLSLSLWDCGGQDAFMENYFESQRNHIFRSVCVLIYVLGIRDGNMREDSEREKDLAHFKSAIDSIKPLSPDAKIFVLVHKMDLIKIGTRERVFKEYVDHVKPIADGLDVKIYPTSIWDETLFKAWSEMVHTLIPNMDCLQEQLDWVCKTCEADEVVLFELSTFLVISSATRGNMQDQHRFEKVSNLVKQFKLSVAKMHTGVKSLTVRNQVFTAVLTLFTANSFILVITSDKDIHPAATTCNIQNCRQHFQSLCGEDGPFGMHL